MSDEPEWLVTNRLLWDGWAAAHAEGTFYDLQGLIAGRKDLRPWELAEVGAVAGKDLIHLQCHLGTDTMDWSRRGATVTALDFSARAMRTVRTMSNWAASPITAIEANVYDAVEAVDGRQFDIVYTGMGSINWLPNLDRWAQVVSDLLRPDGFLYLYEIHPLCAAMNDEGTAIQENLTGAGFERFEEVGSYGAPHVEFEHNVGFERLHSLSELFSAVIGAGLTIELFREFDLTASPAPFLEKRDDGLYRLPDGAPRFPLSYSLRARKPSAD
ncbi:MAG: SAM-dependent methyltransferase [Acidimicrobiales bacterium]